MNVLVVGVGGRHIELLAEAQKRGIIPKGSFNQMDIFHDDYCPCPEAACVCQPTISFHSGKRCGQGQVIVRDGVFVGDKR